MPELKRVIVAYSNRLIMAENLDKALSLVLGGEISPAKIVSVPTPETRAVSKLGVLALEHYNKAKDYLRQGDWAGYGRELEDLEIILRELTEKKKGLKE